MINKKTISSTISPTGIMSVLSSKEIQMLQDKTKSGINKLFRQCALAILNCGSHDNMLGEYDGFDINIIQEPRGLKLELINAPKDAFVEKKLIRGIKENLCSVLRDILYLGNGIETDKTSTNPPKSKDQTNIVFETLRHAETLIPQNPANIVVCWGGHSINNDEYSYTKLIGYELGLRGFDICTGCGQGAMKGPMKGAYIGHAKQRISTGRFIGLSEPSIIAAESPNPIVSELIIMPDIEKRLEAFLRLGHGFIIFPGGAGTTEEIFYLLGILLDKKNENIPFPLVLTGPKSSTEYFEKIDNLISETLGTKAQKLYKIIIDNPTAVAIFIQNGIKEVVQHRKKNKDAYYFNWNLHINKQFQVPFEPTHENMANLDLSLTLSPEILAANIRCAMSGIVSGNLKEGGINAIIKYGPFILSGDKELMDKIDELLEYFIKQKRMKSHNPNYSRCYSIKNQH